MKKELRELLERELEIAERHLVMDEKSLQVYADAELKAIAEHAAAEHRIDEADRLVEQIKELLNA